MFEQTQAYTSQIWHFPLQNFWFYNFLPQKTALAMVGIQGYYRVASPSYSPNRNMLVSLGHFPLEKYLRLQAQRGSA